MNKNYPHIFEPLVIGSTVFRNRIWSAPAGVHLLQGREPYPNRQSLSYYVNKAAGGCAVITYSAQNMDLEAGYDWIHAAENILKPESHRFFGEFTSAIHAQGAKVSLELLAFSYHHVLDDGRRVMLDINESCDPDVMMMTEADIDRIAGTYGDVAEAALQCGFDMLLIHGGHGLVLSQFYSRALNHRTDQYSAENAENQMRFAARILDEIRARVGRQLLIEYRISGEEDPLHHTGYTVTDCIEMIKQIQDKIDIAHISTGAFYNDTENITHPTEFLAHGCNVKYAAAVKACPEIHIPVLTLGAVQNADEAEDILANGYADIVAMARGLISDPSRVEKWRSGKADEAIPCIRCFHCLDYGRAPYFACSVNPEIGRESLLPLIFQKTSERRHVVIIGGGPSGMQAAITAARNGHQVTLLEQSDRLGGKLNFASQVPFKSDLDAFMQWQIRMVNRLDIQVMLNTTASTKRIQFLHPDVVLAAVGASYVMPDIPGIGGENVMTAEEVYQKTSSGSLQNQKVIVIGGGLVGCETGLFLAQERGCEVTILEKQQDVAQDEMHLTRDALLDRLHEKTTILTNAACTAVFPDGIAYQDAEGEHRLFCDLVVLATGEKPKATEALEFSGCAPVFDIIGDCLKPSNVRNATRTGYDAARRIL